MARERSILVRLKAEVSDFQNKMGQASRSLSDFEKSQQKLGGAADTTMGRLVQSARVNEREWTQVGSALMVAGGAITGLGIAAARSGVQYNTLQQTTRAALTTIFQDGAKANAQMDALDNFARNSPFAKQVFIQAQQQMLGFGIEAQKVLPYLDSIQNAVAATGGSNQDIAELATVFSQVHANAKITARELMMFGQRGVDAATIIGSQMGKTGAEIRDEITSGTLDAGEALDALAAGMDERFGGAAANVKETFDGALDRIKAAWRDIGSMMATPLVDPDGGGLLIDFFNGLADAMRQFINAPAWLQGTILALGGLAGVGMLVGGALLVAIPRVAEFSQSLATLGNTHPRLANFTRTFGSFAKQLAGAGTIIAVATTAISALFKAATSETTFPGLRSLTNEIEALSEAGKTAQEIDLDSIISELPTTFGIAKIEAENLGDVLDKLLDPSKTDQFADFFSGVLPTYMQDNREIAEELDAALTHMLTLGGDQEASAVQFMENLGYSAEQLEKVLPGASDALLGVKEKAVETEEVANELAGTLAGVGVSAEESEDAVSDWYAAVAEAGASFGSVLSAYDTVIEKQGDVQYSTAETTEQWIEQMKKQREAAESWRDNIATAMEQIRDEVDEKSQAAHLALVREMQLAGEDGAEQLQLFVDGTKEQRQELIDDWLGTGEAINEAAQLGLEPLDIEANTEPTEEKVNEILAWIGEKTADPMKVDADTSPGKQTVDQMLREWAAETTDTNVDANVDPAKTSSRDLFNEWVTTTTDTNLDADSSKAQAEFNKQTYTWGGTTTKTNLDANSGPAQGVFNSAVSGWAGTTTTTKIDADTSPAQRAFGAFAAGVAQTLVTRIQANTGKYEGGWINPGRYDGGQVLPGRQAGGWVPGQRAGYDNVLWPLHSGGQVLAQPLEGREFVVRSSQAQRYPHELAAMNNGTYPTGTLERAYSPASGQVVNVAAPDLSGIGDQVASAIHGMPIQVTVNADGQAILRVVASAQHAATRGRPAAPLLKQG